MIVALIIALQLAPSAHVLGPEPSAPLGYTHVHYTTAQGLPTDAVGDVAQTDDGFIWLATRNGLVRFDGQTFVTYSLQTHPGLTSDRFVLLETLGDDVWALTERNHLYRFDGARFERFASVGGRDLVVTGTAPFPVRPLLVSRNGRLLVAHDAGVAAYEPGTGELVPLTEGFFTHPATALHEDAAGGLWVGTWYGEVLFRSRTGETQAFSLEGTPGQAIRDILTMPDGSVWATSVSGAYWLPPPTARLDDEFAALSYEGQRVSRELVYARQDGRGGAWLDTWEGDLLRVRDGAALGWVNVADEHSGTTRIPALPFEDIAPWSLGFAPGGMFVDNGAGIGEVLQQENVRAALRDASGALWIASDGGLYHRHPRSIAMVEALAEAGMQNGGLYGVAQDAGGRVWAGSIDGRTFRVSGDHLTPAPAPPSDRRVQHVWAMGTDRSDTLWAAGRGLCAVEPVGDCVDLVEAGVPIGDIRAIHEDRRGRLWVGGEGGLIVRENGAWKRVPVQNRRTGQAPWVRQVMEADDGTLWFATNGSGVLRLHPGSSASGPTMLSRADGFCSDLVRHIHENADGTLWLATEDVGVCFVAHPSAPSPGAMGLATVGPSDGLHALGVHTLQPDGRGRLWMSSNTGLFWVRETQLRAVAQRKSRAQSTAVRVRSVTYDERHGMADAEANGGAQSVAARDTLGRLYFATMRGLARVDPATLPIQPLPRVAIMAARSAGVPVLVQQGAFSLMDTQHDLQLQTGAPTFVQPDAVEVQYRWGGEQAEWIGTGTDRRIWLRGIGAGSSTLELRAVDVLTGTASGITRVRIERDASLAETRLFGALVLVSVLAVCVALLLARARAGRTRAALMERRIEERTQELREALALVESQTEKLRELDEAKSRFFANVSHELRTPLTLIMAPLRGLIAGELEPREHEAQYRLMLRSSQRLLRLVNQILDLARIDNGALALRLRRVDLTALARTTTEAFVPYAAQRGTQLSTTGCAAPVWLRCDGEKMEVVLVNLLSNALKFTGEGDRVSVSVSTRDGFVRLQVKDTGVGIRPEAVPLVFDRFYQEEGSEGTGIGLALVKALVELHGGRIEVSSILDEGTTFTVYLPTRSAVVGEEGAALGPSPALKEAPDSDPLPAPAPTRAHSEPRTTQSAHDAASDADDESGADVPLILVAEDNDDLRAYLTRLLARDYRIVVATDGEEAERLALHHLPDLVLSDVMMPRKTGVALAAAIKAAPSLGGVPVVLLTAKAGHDSKLEALELGADDYLAKPFDPDELRLRVRNLLEQRRRVRERFSPPQPSGSYAHDADGMVPATSPGQDRDSLVRRAESVLRQHLGEADYGARDLAEDLGLSYSTFRRRLRDEAGATPAEFIRVYRLDAAAALLTGGDVQVSEVAYAVGFRSLSYFSTAFSKHFGVPPSEYARASQDAP